MAEFTFSKIVLTQGYADTIRRVVEFMVDENGDDSGSLLLTLEATEERESEKNSKRICVEYFSETQILELYFFLKANLAAKHHSIL